MTGTLKRSPSWGAFKELKPRCDASREVSAEVVDMAPVNQNESVSNKAQPAFDVQSPTLPLEQTFYAVDAVDRDEEEFDELGEGAIRQIGRSFISLVGAGSAAALVAAVVIWTIPNDRPGSVNVATSESESTLQVASLNNEVVTGREFFVDASADEMRSEPDEVTQFIEIDVELPVPSVIEAAIEGSTPPVSTIVDATGYPGPVPMPRDLAYVAMATFEESPMAQGSDDEAMSAATFNDDVARSDNGTFVSVMIPKPRPVF
jgi:hypothetical protein